MLRPSAARRDPPRATLSAVLDPALTPLHRAPDQVGQALLLAVLLHVLLLVAIGNAPGGSAKPGEGAWGPLNVRLQGDRFEPGSGEPATVLPERGPPGDAKQPRFGGTVREQPPTPEELKTPGAARQGQWRQQAGDELIGDIAEERGAPPEPAAVKPTLKPTPRPTTTPTPKPSPAPKPAPTPSPIPAAEAPPTAPEVTTLTTPTESSVAAPTRIAPSRDAAPVRPTLPSEGLQAPSSELNLPERPAPMLSETPTTVRRLDRAPIERAVTPPMPNELKAPAELPPLTPLAPAPTPAPAPVPSPAPVPKPLAAPPLRRRRHRRPHRKSRPRQRQHRRRMRPRPRRRRRRNLAWRRHPRRRQPTGSRWTARAHRSRRSPASARRTRARGSVTTWPRRRPRRPTRPSSIST